MALTEFECEQALMHLLTLRHKFEMLKTQGAITGKTHDNMDDTLQSIWSFVIHAAAIMTVDGASQVLIIQRASGRTTDDER